MHSLNLDNRNNHVLRYITHHSNILWGIMLPSDCIMNTSMRQIPKQLSDLQLNMRNGFKQIKFLKLTEKINVLLKSFFTHSALLSASQQLEVFTNMHGFKWQNMLYLVIMLLLDSLIGINVKPSYPAFHQTETTFLRFLLPSEIKYLSPYRMDARH